MRLDPAKEITPDIVSSIRTMGIVRMIAYISGKRLNI